MTHKTVMLAGMLMTLSVSAWNFDQVDVVDVDPLNVLCSGWKPAPVAKRQRVLWFSECFGYNHHGGRCYGDYTFRTAGENSGAWELVQVKDVKKLADAEFLKGFGAIVFCNSSGLEAKMAPGMERALVNFVEAGGGIAVIHAGLDAFKDSDVLPELFGGYFRGHPWHGDGTWRFLNERPANPINASFRNEPASFSKIDEIYQFPAVYDRAKCEVLISMDVSDPVTRAAERWWEWRFGKGSTRADHDYAVSWTKTRGKGRVFYTSFGHDRQAFLDRERLYHMFAGLQYVLGDLPGGDGSARPRRLLELPPAADNPRNSEGDFAELRDGRLVYTYSRYTTANGGDHAPACLASIYSSDGGKTWTAPETVVSAPDGALNVMSVSYKRLKDGSLALFYLRKNTEKDCRPMMRVSRDEGRTWGAPTLCVPDAEVGYYVLNNCRVERLKSGRLVLPLWQQSAKVGGKEVKDLLGCYLSDDEGASWRRGRFAETVDAEGRHVVVQEPGVVELKDGSVLLYARTDRGRQWFFRSSDGCETFTGGEPGSLVGPLSPATIKRLRNGDLLAVWNDHEFAPDLAKAGPRWANGLRTPLTLAISRDEGRTWINRRKLVEDPKGWYCYFAVLEREDELLLGYGAEGVQLDRSRLMAVPISWLY